MGIPEVLGIIAFVVAMGHAAVALLRWAREPTFEVLAAHFPTQERQGIRVIQRGGITVLALGGARTRRIVDWKLMMGPAGGRHRTGINLVVEPIMETIPAHEPTKFSLQAEAGLVIEKEDVRRLDARLYLRLGSDWERIRFFLHQVSTGDFSLERPRYWKDSPTLLDSLPWWRRTARRILRRFS